MRVSKYKVYTGITIQYVKHGKDIQALFFIEMIVFN